jgi:putative Holliday junction resolvase
MRAVSGDIEVVLHDERLTTVTAERALGEARMSREARRRVVDKVAAAVMLQSWLERAQP